MHVHTAMWIASVATLDIAQVAEPCLAAKTANVYMLQFHLDDSKGRAGAVLPGPLYNMFLTRASAS